MNSTNRAIPNKFPTLDPVFFSQENFILNFKNRCIFTSTGTSFIM